MKLFAMVLSLSISSATAFADWGGILDGAATTKDANYDNCDIQVDFYVNHAKNTFEVAHLNYSCGMASGTTLYRSFDDIRMVIANTQLLLNGIVVGTMTDTTLTFSLQQNGGADFKFEAVAGTAAWDTTILDKTSGEQIEGRLW